MSFRDSIPIGGDGVRCKFCHSTGVVRNGSRRHIQYWLCRECGRGFVDNRALPKMKYPVGVVAGAVEDYYRGDSLYHICQAIERETGRRPSISAVYEWVRKFTRKGLREVQKCHPRVGDRWLVVITSVWLNRQMYLFISVLDADTRFLLASRVGKFREIRTALETARDCAERYPGCIMTDGWKGYGDIIERIFGADTVHRVISPVERDRLAEDFLGCLKGWCSIFKTKYKLMLHPERNARWLIEGLVFSYNFLRPLRSLGNQPPAAAAGVAFTHRSWLDIVKNGV